MDLVNSLGGSLVNRASNFSTSNIHGLDTAGSQSESGPSRSGGNSAITGMGSASEVSSVLLDLFKATLGEADSYLSVFEARLKLEEEYVRGLKALSDKSRESTARLDAKIVSATSFEPGRVELPKARLAWKEVQDNTLREIDARTQYIEMIRQSVIAPLYVYRDGQERIRKRVKDDLKTSIAAYDEMRQHTLPRAKKAYEKRSEEVEQLRLQQVAIEEQKLLLSQTGMHRDGSQHSHSALEDRTFSPSSSNAQSDLDDDQTRFESESAGGNALHRPLSRRNSQRNSKQFHRSIGSDSGESAGGSGMGGARPASSGASPRLGAEQSLSTSPPIGEKKGHFLDALRSRETWETARKEGPKKLNALLSRMREGATSSDKTESQSTLSVSPDSNAGQAGALGVSLGKGPGSFKTNQTLALKNVKAKREAEEADKAYRKAVFDLETLRMRRQKTLAAAKASAIEARRELYLTCQAVWLQAEQSVQGMSNAQLSLSMHAEDIVRQSLTGLETELKRLETNFPAVDEAYVAYNNYHFGESKNLIFGVSLTDYAFSRAQHAPPHLGPPKAEAPIIVQKCIRYIEERALDQPGIYRTSAKHTAIQNLAHAVERDEERFEFSATDDEPSTVAGVLKLYLRQLPEPVLPMPWEERVRYTHERQEQIQTGFASLKGRIRRLPTINQATLRMIIEHLAKVASHAEQNKMTASNLSIIFGPLLLSQLDHDATSIAAAMEEDRVTEDMILYADTIFDLTKAGAPVLPLLPAAANTTTAGEQWELNQANQQTAIRQTSEAVELQDPTSAKSFETVVPSASQPAADQISATTIASVPQSAADAYLPTQLSNSPPPFVQSGVVIDEHSSDVHASESDRLASIALEPSKLPATDVDSGHKAAIAPNESMGSGEHPLDSTPQAQNQTIEGNNLLTPIDTANATPMTAVSSANASIGHGLISEETSKDS